MGEQVVNSEILTAPAAGKKPQLHQSGMSRLLRCGVQWELRNIQGVRRPPSFRLLEGAAVHKAAERALRGQAIGQLPALDAIVQEARDALTSAIGEQGVRLTPDDQEIGLDRRRGQAVDFVTDVAQFVGAEVAPIIVPRSEDHVEWRWVIELPDRSFDLAGTSDVVEIDGTVRDLKTKTKAPPKGEADSSPQLTWYAMARQIFDGALPGRMVLDHVVRTPAQRRLYHAPQETVRVQEDVDAEKLRIDRAMRSIETGVFLPADPATSWWCNPRWCEYHSICPCARRGTIIQMGGVADE